MCETWYSPLPSPDQLREYKEIMGQPFVDLLIKQSEDVAKTVKEENDRYHALELKNIKLQDEQLRAQRDEVKRGQLFGLIIGLAALTAGSVTSIMGSPWSGGFIGAGGVVGLVAVFVIGKKKKSISRGNKIENI